MMSASVCHANCGDVYYAKTTSHEGRVAEPLSSHMLAP